MRSEIYFVQNMKIIVAEEIFELLEIIQMLV